MPSLSYPKFPLFSFAVFYVNVNIFSKLLCPTEILAPSRVLHDFIFLACIPIETEYSITTEKGPHSPFQCISLRQLEEWGSMGFIVDFHSYSFCISRRVLFLINFTRNVTLPKSIIKYIVYVWIIMWGLYNVFAYINRLFHSW